MVGIFIPSEGLLRASGISNYPVEVILFILIFVCIVKSIVGKVNYFRLAVVLIQYKGSETCQKAI